jgi:hypothetical protein
VSLLSRPPRPGCSNVAVANNYPGAVTDSQVLNVEPAPRATHAYAAISRFSPLRAGLRMAYERPRTLPMRMTVTVVVRAPNRPTLERRTKRLRQRVKDLGAEGRLLRWEQRAGWLVVAPLRRSPPSRRGVPVETGTVARTYPWSAGTLTIEGGVPFGVAAAAPGDVHHRGAAQQEPALLLVRHLGCRQGLQPAGAAVTRALR